MKVGNPLFNVLRFNHKNWKAVVLCFLAATVFWFFNALNKTYTTNINFPLTFDYDQNNFVPVKSLPREVRINVTGNGWDLFRRGSGVKIPALEIPLERPMETRKIVGSTLPAFFSNQMEGLQINYVLTDTLYLNLEPKIGRWVSLGIDTSKLSVKNGFMLASRVSIMPDSIYLEGPKPLVNEMKEPIVINVPFENIDENFMEDVEVQVPSSDIIKRNPPTVAVMFNVEKTVTIQDSIRLVIENLPSTVWPVLGRKEIPITVAIPQSMQNLLILDSAKAILDLKTVARGDRKILPRIEGLPAFTKVIHLDSVRVKF
ncbi:hypothetical protein [Chryseosolibacter indicus]|uniref:YbbR-like domain-containing protein n=1 Tax=Chryseosolibacter indicus TaxID=2782351 RepID=A0ABS5VS02_9BACT|nr:hypothetical protein [Chryseosolibacter indicus]MBT1703567.1 hypothetical protein [Chryseosolibacter indicus]